MWFWNRNRVEREMKLGSDGAAGARPVGRLTSVPAAARSANDTSWSPPTGGAPATPDAPAELHVQYRETKQFDPPRRRLARNKVIAHGAPSDAIPAYNLLRTQVIRRLQENEWSTVAITSPSRGTGTTLTAINLAISIARDFSYTVLLVELDLVTPSFHDVLGFKPQKGIVDHLVDDVPLPEILLNPGIERLVVVPAGAPVPNSAELISSPKMTRLVAELKERYEHRIVLFDLPPVLAIDDAMAFSRFVDCALLVVEEGETRLGDVRQALDYLKSTQMLGVVLNRSVNVEAARKTNSRRS